MKSFLKPLFALSALAFLVSQAMAHPSQPWIIPATGDIGVYAAQDQSIGPTDPDLAKAYDNFSLSTDRLITGFQWAGVYAEPLPPVPSGTDFLIEIWNTDPANNDFADVWIGPVMTFALDGGTAGLSGPDVTVSPLGHTSPATSTTFGGGPAFEYSTFVTPTALAAGNYWISILADQEFANAVEIDPEWQWHLGDRTPHHGGPDGFTSFDRTLDPPGTLQAGIFQPNKDLAFTIHTAPVPEPSSMLMALFGLAPLGLLRRGRK